VAIEIVIYNFVNLGHFQQHLGLLDLKLAEPVILWMQQQIFQSLRFWRNDYAFGRRNDYAFGPLIMPLRVSNPELR